jgi:hypothetical protein
MERVGDQLSDTALKLIAGNALLSLERQERAALACVRANRSAVGFWRSVG